MSDTFDTVLAFVNQALPVAPPFDRSYFPGPGYVDQAFAAGKTAREYADALVKSVQALGIPVDPSGQYQGARKAAFTGEFNTQDLLVAWLNGGTFPTDQQFRDRIFGGQGNPPGTTPPAEPPPVVPPTPTPVGGFATSAELQALANRVATLEAQMKGIRDALGATTGGPGGA
jgi:hypothetical protein